MDRLHFSPTPLGGLWRAERQASEDERGSFSRIFCAGEVAAATAMPFVVAQANHSWTRSAGCVRGLHFQHAPHADAKIVSCLRGSIFDVAVDLRPASPTFARWHGEILSLSNRRALVIPEGFAHGFQALEDDCELIYLHSQPYVAAAEGGLDPTDPALAIGWPLAITELSERDRRHPRIAQGFAGS